MAEERMKGMISVAISERRELCHAVAEAIDEADFTARVCAVVGCDADEAYIVAELPLLKLFREPS